MLCWYLQPIVLCRSILSWRSKHIQERTGEIVQKDVDCLLPGEMLTDGIINFYLNHLVDSAFPCSVHSKLFIFSSLFYNKMQRFQKDKVSLRRCEVILCASASLCLCVKHSREHPPFIFCTLIAGRSEAICFVCEKTGVYR